jgi:hypothetical protein
VDCMQPTARATPSTNIWPTNRNGVLVMVEGQSRVILHERGWRAEQCAVHAVVELYAGNIFKHMQVVRVKMELGVGCILSLEEAISMVQMQQQRIPA